MASKTGMFLRSRDRDRIISELETKGIIEKNAVPAAEQIEAAVASKQPVEFQEAFGTGCLGCGSDNDHANVLLCERCNAEYHTYCLDPPLRAVPAGDWFCEKCTMWTEAMGEDDGLDRLINVLSPTFTSRFGEICWAQGGVGFGWWPSFIYDPRLTVGNARQLARKNLGRRHLVYFFECHDAPFAVLTDAKLLNWEDGLAEDYHQGKTARAAGKQRLALFFQAMQAATVEAGKPIEMRLDFNHTEQAQILPSPKQTAPTKRVRNKESKNEKTSKRKSSSKLQSSSGSKKSGGAGGIITTTGSNVSQSSKSSQRRSSTKRNLSHEIEQHITTATPIESLEDSPLFCKLLKKNAAGSGNMDAITNVGFVKLSSRKHSTFEEARNLVESDIIPDCINPGQTWKFFIPSLGPVSIKQEASLGPLFNFLRQSTTDKGLGNGTLRDPIKVIIMECPPIGNASIDGENTSINSRRSSVITE